MHVQQIAVLLTFVLVVGTASARAQLPRPEEASAPPSPPSEYADSGSPGCEVGFSGCDGCCDGDWECCEPSRFRHVWTFLSPGCSCTTGVLFPHYAYFPERHGYYDFAPYNPGVLREQIRLAPALGEPITNPFKRAMFPGIYAEHENTAYPEENGDSFVPQLQRVEAALPDLEAILNSKSTEQPPEPPAPGTP